MARTINIKCIQCKEEFTIEPYFCNTDIYYRDDGYAGARRYFARTVATAVCPRCGELNGQPCESEIYKADILDLAIRKYRRGD
jgi:hypothetical protein